MYNKSQFQKYNDRKVLHKIHKQWVTVSLTLLALFGYKAATTNIHADVNSQGSNQSTNSSQINNDAQAMHTTLLTNALTTPATATNNGQATPVRQINNLNQLKMNQAGNFQGVTYKRVALPTHSVKVNNTTILLHSNINSIGYVKNYYRSLHHAKRLQVSRAFIDENKHLLRFEVAGPKRHIAFITGHDTYVTRLPTSTNYRYYERKIQRLLAQHPSSNLNGMQHALNRLLKHGNHNYQRYLHLYNQAFDKVYSLDHYDPANTHRSIRESYNHLYSDLIKALTKPQSNTGFNFNYHPAISSTAHNNVQPALPIPGAIRSHRSQSASAIPTRSAVVSSASSSDLVSSSSAESQSTAGSNTQPSSSASAPQSSQSSSAVKPTSNQNSSSIAPTSNQAQNNDSSLEPSYQQPSSTTNNQPNNSTGNNHPQSSQTVPNSQKSSNNNSAVQTNANKEQNNTDSANPNDTSSNSSSQNDPILNQIKAEILKDINSDEVDQQIKDIDKRIAKTKAEFDKMRKQLVWTNKGGSKNE